MKNLTKLTNVALLLTSLSSYAQQAEVLPKAFYKKCLVTSITGGPSRALFTTYTNDGEKVHSDMANGQIDPLIMEYGLTDKIGIGFSRGGENYSIDADKFYRADLPEYSSTMWTSTKYLTADISYHPYCTKRLDVSLFGSTGIFKVTGDVYKMGEWCDPLYNYTGRGAIVRAGVRSRFYFTKRFGVMAMAYGFNGIVKAKHIAGSVSDQKNNSGYTTNVAGGGLEFGICFRIFKQKGVKEETLEEKLARKEEARAKKEEKREMKESDKVPLFRFVWD